MNIAYRSRYPIPLRRFQAIKPWTGRRAEDVVLIPKWENGDPSGRSPEDVFEHIRRIQWAAWEILSERFHFPETLRFTVCEEVAGALVEAGAIVND